MQRFPWWPVPEARGMAAPPSNRRRSRRAGTGRTRRLAALTTALLTVAPMGLLLFVPRARSAAPLVPPVNVYIANTGGNFGGMDIGLIEVPAGGGTTNTFPVSSGLDNPFGVAVDAAGDIFVADSFNDRVLEQPAGGGAPVTLADFNTPVTKFDNTNHALEQPVGVAVDN